MLVVPKKPPASSAICLAAIAQFKRHFDAPRLGVVALPVIASGLMSSILSSATPAAVSAPYRHRARFGQLVVLRRIAGRVGVAADGRALARRDALDDIGQRRSAPVASSALPVAK